MSEESGGGEQPVKWMPEELIMWFAFAQRYCKNPLEELIYPRTQDDAKPRLERLEADRRYQEHAEAYRRQRDEQERREAEQRRAARNHTEKGKTEQPHRMLYSLPDADRYLFYFCMKAIIGSDDLADDGEANLNFEAQGEAQYEYDAWVKREAARFISAAEQIFDWTFLRYLIDAEGGFTPGAPDGPPLPNDNDAA